MKKKTQHIACTIAAVGILALSMMAVFAFTFFLIGVIAVLAVGTGMVSVFERFKIRQFNLERKAAMEAAEALSCSLEFYEKDLPFSYYHRFQFRRALDNAHNVSLSLRVWISLVHQHLDRRSNLGNGLQLKDVPSFVDDINDQVRNAYIYIRDGSKGPAPKILDPFWFDQSTICGDEVRLLPTHRDGLPTRGHNIEHYRRLSTVYPTLRSVQQAKQIEAASELFVSTQQVSFEEREVITSNYVVDVTIGTPAQVEHANANVLPTPTEQTACEQDVEGTSEKVDEQVFTARQFEQLRKDREGRNTVNALDSKVLSFDTTKRKAKR